MHGRAPRPHPGASLLKTGLLALAAFTVAGDRACCFHQAPSEALLRAQAPGPGLPGGRIRSVSALIDPAPVR